MVLLGDDTTRYGAAAHAGEHGGASLAEVVTAMFGSQRPYPAQRVALRNTAEAWLAVVLFGIGRGAGVIASIIYAIPPMIRLTNLGIRMVDKDVLEAADAFGSSSWQKLWKVQLPLALPTIMAGINQTIMMALAMVVIASMIGVQGLGQPVLRAINSQYFTLGMFNGLAIVGIAIIFDRISQAFGRRLQQSREAAHG